MSLSPAARSSHADTFLPRIDQYIPMKGNMFRQRSFFDELARAKGIDPLAEPNRLAEISIWDIRKYSGGTEILKIYKSSKKALVSVYSELNLYHKDIGTTRDKWTRIDAQRQFFDSLAKSLRFDPLQDPNRWYEVSYADISARGGARVVKINKTYANAIVNAYPELQLDVAKFTGKVDVRRFFDSFAESKGFHPTEQIFKWNEISSDDVLAHEGGATVLSKFASLSTALSFAYPQFFSSKWGFKEKYFRKVVLSLFPNVDIKFKARKDSGLFGNDQTRSFDDEKLRSYLELDIWIQELNIGFEFQDHYHFIEQWPSNRPLHEIQQRDREKSRQMRELGKTLVQVPIWWDMKKESLAATIRAHRPDLLSEFVNVSVAPISVDPPPNYFRSNLVPGVGQLMLSTFVERQSDIKNWWIGEKYDGTRACYNPNEQSIFSRHAYRLKVPIIFISCLANIFMDGELWIGRTQHEARLFSSNNENFQKWQLVRFIAFDSPPKSESKIRSIAYEDRFRSLLENLQISHPFTLTPSRHLCRDKKYMHAFCNSVVKGKGEGVMLMRPNFVYENSRSRSVLKYKGMVDAEALVVKIKGDQYICKLPTEQLISAVKASKKSKMQVKIGSIVSFAEILPNRPKVYKIHGIRTDVIWEDLVNDYKLFRS